MSISKKVYGENGGRTVYEFAIDNGKGLSVHILNYGGIITKLIFNGTDVVLGRDSLEEYLDNDGYFGALIGRNSNRIENSEFELNGKVYKLYPNDGRNSLHGGKVGFNAKVWDADVAEGDEPSLMLTLVSPDGEEGYPGNLNIKVTYTVTLDNALIIHYEGISDKDTIFNMTNHSYFNLNGHNSGTIDNHKLWLASSFYTPNSDECMPTGEILSVSGTAFDFSTDKTLGERFNSNNEQIEMFGGFDHNICLDGRGYRYAGKLVGDKSGITMEMYTDCNGVQLYTGNCINEDRVCKEGARYPKHGALCLETQTFPNFTKYSHFPSGFIKKGEKFESVTEYKFK